MNGQFLYRTSHTICTPHMKPYYCSIFEIWTLIHLESIKTLFLISTKMNGQFLLGRPILHAHPYETILLQHFQEMGHYKF